MNVAVQSGVERYDWIKSALGTGAVVAVLLLVWNAPTIGIGWKENFATAFFQSLSALMLVALCIERVVEVFVSIWQDRRVDELHQQMDYQKSLQLNRQREVRELDEKLSKADLPAEDVGRLRERRAKKEKEMDDAETGAEKCGQQLVPLQAATRRMATWIAVVIGIVTAAVGVRILSNLVETNALTVRSAASPTTNSASGTADLRNGKEDQATQPAAGSTASSVAVAQPQAPANQYGWFVIVDILLTGAVLAGGSKAVHEIFSFYETFMASGRSVLESRKITQSTPPVPPGQGS